MNTPLEIGIVVAAGGLAVAFLIRQVVRTLGNKRPTCCSGGAGCPNCIKKAMKGGPVSGP